MTSVNPHSAHADLIATYRRAEAEKKGPKAIQTAIDTSAKAAKRRDAYAKKLLDLGVTLDA